jgi:hypothetical protein
MSTPSDHIDLIDDLKQRLKLCNEQREHAQSFVNGAHVRNYRELKELETKYNKAIELLTQSLEVVEEVIAQNADSLGERLMHKQLPYKELADEIRRLIQAKE